MLRNTNKNKIPKLKDTCKGASISFGEEIQTHNINVHNMNEVIIETQTHLSFYVTSSFIKLVNSSQRKIRSTEHCLKQEKWQGPPHINKVKNYETVMVSLFIQS